MLRALVAPIAVVCCADLYRSLPLHGSLLGHHICSLLAQFSIVDRCFGCLFCQFCPQTPSHPHRKWFMVGIRLGEFPLKFLQCDGAGWWPLAGLVPAHRVAMEPPCCAWYLHRAPTNLGWHQLPSSSIIGDEFKYSYTVPCLTEDVFCFINTKQVDSALHIH